MKVFKDIQKSTEAKTTVGNLLKSIYACLTHFCRNNRQNQILLSEFYDYFIDEIEFDFGQT